MEANNLKYKSMRFKTGSTQLPGIKPLIYYIEKRHIIQWPVLPESFVESMGELVTYDGSFILAAGEFWKDLSVVVDKSPLDGKGQGTRPSKTFLNQVVLMHEGVEEDASGFAKQANNDDFVYLVPTKKGKYRVIGNDMFQTDNAIEQNLGATATDEMGTKITATVTDVAPGLFYVGEIVTEDGIINEVDNKVESVSFAPAGGTIEPGTDNVTLTSATVGAVIKYRLDDGDWKTYTGPISTAAWTAGNHSIIARATKDGMFPSVATTAYYFV